jgi:hypothetical protein
MRKILPVLILLIISLSGCKKDATTTQFDNSYKKWQQFKNQSIILTPI